MKAILLSVFLGLFGGYRFYKKQPFMGILYLFTGGLYFVGWIIDMSMAFREYFENKACSSGSYTSEGKIKAKSIVAAILSGAILCSTIVVIGLCTPEVETKPTPSKTSYGYCVSCGKKVEKSRLYSGFCGKCYGKWKDAKGNSDVLNYALIYNNTSCANNAKRNFETFCDYFSRQVASDNHYHWVKLKPIGRFSVLQKHVA